MLWQQLDTSVNMQKQTNDGRNRHWLVEHTLCLTSEYLCYFKTDKDCFYILVIIVGSSLLKVKSGMEEADKRTPYSDAVWWYGRYDAPEKYVSIWPLKYMKVLHLGRFITI